MYLSDKWEDYRLIDCAGGEKLEYWGKYLLRRPDPQAIWSAKSENKLWEHPDAWYHRSSSGGGSWQYFKGKNGRRAVPERWSVRYGDLTFNIKPMGFKHTGLFPEQAVNWDWFSELIRDRKAKNNGDEIRILNLFAYTGGATAAALNAGASVCHVDASKGMVTWAKENIISSGLEKRSVRYIVDDVVKFVRREIRRAKTYDAIIMDPPSYGRGPSGELWKIEDDLFPLISDCIKLLSDNPLFFLINCYTTGLTETILSNTLAMTMQKKYGGIVDADEIGLPILSSGLAFPCGISGRWCAK